MDTSECARRVTASSPRRLPGEHIPLRPARSYGKNTPFRSWVCTDCHDILSWARTDHSHGVPLCSSCARNRRVNPPPSDNFELAARLTLVQTVMKEQLLTAYALLEGTPFEPDLHEWGGLISSALDAAPGTPASVQCMSATIARIREPFIHGGSVW
jgi:hypothetical protein